MKKVKHTRRKVTQAQVDAMNRELELKGANYRYKIGHDGRLTESLYFAYSNGCW